ncbi:hypothetical protein WG219_18495 [Ectopseudomonas mendocina]|uniref:Uncharacterized protein n=1 Tax=Ectopseudomonas mendocina TaxID=300 RepID=A0ABZ2REP7_ECTME
MGITDIGAYLTRTGTVISKPSIGTSATLKIASPAQAGASPSIEVSLSPQGQFLASGDLPGWIGERLEFLRSDPDQTSAMKWVESLATGQGGGLISNGPNSDGVNDVYWAATGEPVTPESKARVERISLQIQQATTAIYQNLRAEGKSAADIFASISQYMSTQPKDYLEINNWYRPTYATA